MNKNQMQSILKDLTEQKAPAAQIDLWSAIQSHIQMSQPTPSRGTIMNMHSHSQRRLLKPALIALAVLLIGVLFSLHPQGRALAQEVMHFFYQGESNAMPGVTVTPFKWVEQTPGVAAATLTPALPQPTQPGLAFEDDCGSLNDPHCSVEAIRERVTFPVFALAELPEGLNFAGATGNPDRVSLIYTTSNQAGSLLIIEGPLTAAESQLAGEVGAEADIQSVLVGAVTAEYVKGSYDGNINPPQWNNDADVQTLRWVDQGLLFNLYLIGTEPGLGRDDLAALAAALTDGPVAESGSPVVETAVPSSEPVDLHTVYPLTLAEAEEKAGAALLSPSRLPEPLTFVGANYDEQTRVVELLFHYDQPNYPQATDGLVVREQLAPEGVDCDLCGFVQGNGKQVEQYPTGKLVSEDAQIETVQIGDLTGQYLEGIGWTSATACCGWQWDSTPYIKRLRFQANGLAIDLSAYTFELTKADLITIAESLK